MTDSQHLYVDSWCVPMRADISEASGSRGGVVCVATLMSTGAILTLLDELYALRILNYSCITFIHFLSAFLPDT